MEKVFCVISFVSDTSMIEIFSSGIESTDKILCLKTCHTESALCLQKQTWQLR